MSATKDRILQTALNQFNKQGTYAVTTNHIAEACGISPGNLYYHFKNKEAIIYALFERMINAWDAEPLDISRLPPAQLIDQQLEKTFHYVWAYRFIHRELSSLLDRDSELKKMTNKVLQRRLKEIEQLLLGFETIGILKPLELEERQFVARTALHYGLFWQPFLEAVGERPTRENVLRGVEMIRLLLKPYLITPLF